MDHFLFSLVIIKCRRIAYGESSSHTRNGECLKNFNNFETQ